jgi:hypothetical protein
MRLVILDPGLKEFSGHHFNYNGAILGECRVRGIDLSIYTSIQCTPDVLEALPATPCFEASTYDMQEIATRKEMETKFSFMNAILERDLMAHVTRDLGAEDLVLFLTTTVFQVVGVLNWYSTLVDPKPAICMQFMHHPWYLGLTSDPDFCTTLQQQSMAAWQASGHSRVRFAADNELLAGFLHRISGMPILLLPMPIRYPPLPGPAASRSGPVRFGFLGDGRPEKGLHHFVTAALLQKDAPLPEAEFFIHVSNQHGRNAGEILRDVPNCQVLCRQVSNGDYWKLVGSCDVVVLPYDPRFYHIRGSGIVFEAMGMGKPVIVTAGSCLDWLVAKHGGAGLRCEGDGRSLLQAVEVIARDFHDFAVFAKGAAPAIRVRHSPSSFMDVLLAPGSWA